MDINVIVWLFTYPIYNLISTEIDFNKDCGHDLIIFDFSAKIETEWISKLCHNDKLLSLAFIFNIVDFRVVCKERQRAIKWLG